MSDREKLPGSASSSQEAEPDSGHCGPLTLDEVRRQHIQKVLEMCGGNRLRAAKILGIGRTSLYRFLKRGARRSAGPVSPHKNTAPSENATDESQHPRNAA